MTGAGLGLEVKHESGVVSAWRGHMIGHVSPCTVQAVVGSQSKPPFKCKMSRPHGLELLSPGGPGNFTCGLLTENGKTNENPQPTLS